MSDKCLVCIAKEPTFSVEKAFALGFVVGTEYTGGNARVLDHLCTACREIFNHEMLHALAAAGAGLLTEKDEEAAR